MKQRKARVLLVALLCGLLVAGGAWAWSALSYAIHWNVIGGGGGPASSASYRLNTTLGQAAIGSSASAHYRLGAGYWYGVEEAAPGPTATHTATPTRTRTPTRTPTGTTTPVAGYSLYLPVVIKNFWTP